MITTFGNTYRGDTAKNYETKNVGETWDIENQVIGDFLRQIKPSTLLDAPIGTGRFLETYKELGIKVKGIDISGDMVDIAMTEAERLSFPTDISVGDIGKLIVDWRGSKKFDCVVCVRFFSFVDEIDAMIKTLLDQTKKYIILSVILDDKIKKITITHNGRTVHGYEYFFRVLEKYSIKVWDCKTLTKYNDNRKYYAFLLRKN